MLGQLQQGGRCMLGAGARWAAPIHLRRHLHATPAAKQAQSTQPGKVTTGAQEAASDKPKLLLVDGHSLAFRSYFAPVTPGGMRLATSDGAPVAVCFGFIKALIRVLKEERPDCLAVAFDEGKTFRHEMYPDYKAHRREAPEDFAPDYANLRRLLEALKVPTFVSPGFEADDALGTLAAQALQRGAAVRILSGDRDMWQLLQEGSDLRILTFGGAPPVAAASARGRDAPYQTVDAAFVNTKLGVPPSQVCDYKALVGDASDNIPGVKGIGTKTALELLANHPSLAAIYAALDASGPAAVASPAKSGSRRKTKDCDSDVTAVAAAAAAAGAPAGGSAIKPAVAKKLLADRANAQLSLELARIRLDAAGLEGAVGAVLARPRGQADRPAVLDLLNELEFTSLIKSIDDWLPLF